MSSRVDYDVAVVGAGPVGVVCALSLARKGASVLLCESEPQVNRNPRAATTHPATLEMLDELGLLEDVVRTGVTARYFQFWDRLTGRKVAEFDHDVLRDDTRFPYVIQCEQHKIANIGIDRLRGHENCRVMLDTSLAAFRDAGDHVEITLAEGGQPERTLRASYLVGCDGGRSFVRKTLGIPFEGFTHPERFIVLTTPFDFEAEYGLCYRSYFSDPDEWANVFKVAGDDHTGLWRVVFPTHLDETDEEALSDDGVQARLQKFFPRSKPYEMAHRNIYRVHQRVAAQFRQGRVLLAGDAAHVNNPIGGLGMNFGIHDAVAVAAALDDRLNGRAGDEILEAYDRIRRPLNVEFVQNQTIQNKKRLEEKDLDVRQRNLDELGELAKDPARHRQHLLRTSLLESVRKERLLSVAAAL